MKRTRVLMNVVAFVFAIGAAYASAKSPLVQGYKFVAPDQPCSISVQCSGEGNACMDGQAPVGDSQAWSGTSCGTPLDHTP